MSVNTGAYSLFKAAMPRAKKRPPAEDKVGGSSNEGAAKGSSPSKKKALDSKFGGMTEEQVMELFLPDHLAKDLDIIFVRETGVPMLGRCICDGRLASHLAPSLVDWHQPRSLLCLHWPSL